MHYAAPKELEEALAVLSSGKVRILGTSRVAEEEVFVLDFLQAREESWVRRPFFARFDPQATWLDQLRPAFGEKRFFFEECPPMRYDPNREIPTVTRTDRADAIAAHPT